MAILIVYASKYGSTERCAKMLASKLKASTELIDLKATMPEDLSKYDTVIIGSPLYIGRMRKEVRTFCSKNLEKLKKLQLGLFLCGMSEGEAVKNSLINGFPEELRAKATIIEWFGGEFQLDKMGFLDKFIVKKMTKVSESKSNLLNEKIIEFAHKLDD